MKREYTIHFTYTVGNEVVECSNKVSEEGLEDRSDKIAEEYRSYFKDDKNFSVSKIERHPCGLIDFNLIDRMEAVREMCALGSKARSEAKIKNRQPLRNGYVLFSDSSIQDYMLYQDMKEEYRELICDELNICNIEYVKGDEKRFFNYKLKPNFKSLGPKGFGKQAQQLKGFLAGISSDDSAKIYDDVKNSSVPVVVQGIPLTLEDLEVEYGTKPNYTSSSGKVGAIILDTTLDDSLLKLGFIAEFKSAIQNLRKQMNLIVTDKIEVYVIADKNISETLISFSNKIKRDLMLNGIYINVPVSAVLGATKHDVEVDGNNLSIIIERCSELTIKEKFLAARKRKETPMFTTKINDYPYPEFPGYYGVRKPHTLKKRS